MEKYMTILGFILLISGIAVVTAFDNLFPGTGFQTAKVKIKKFSIGFMALLIMLTAGACSIKDKVNGPDGNTRRTTQESSNSASELKVHFIDVGQADSILVQFGDSAMLIDAGNNDDADKVKEYIESQGITRLEYVIGTHPHEDHIGGMDAVIDAFDIGKIYMPKVSSNTKTFKDVLDSISKKGLKITQPIPGTSFLLGAAECEILAPNDKNYENLNNYSIVVKLTYKNTSFLFEGDAESLSEKEMINRGFNLSSDVLKIGHHGSSSSTSTDFLDIVNPKYAVISVGKGNDYGHPTKITMDKLKKRGIPVYRTDECGTIVAVSDGSSISFSTKPGDYSYASN